MCQNLAMMLGVFLYFLTGFALIGADMAHPDDDFLYRGTITVKAYTPNEFCVRKNIAQKPHFVKDEEGKIRSQTTQELLGEIADLVKQKGLTGFYSTVLDKVVCDVVLSAVGVVYEAYISRYWSVCPQDTEPAPIYGQVAVQIAERCVFIGHMIVEAHPERDVLGFSLLCRELDVMSPYATFDSEGQTNYWRCGGYAPRLGKNPQGKAYKKKQLQGKAYKKKQLPIVKGQDIREVGQLVALFWQKDSVV